MNGPEFFMRYVGYLLLPPDQHTQDAVTDANRLFSIALAAMYLCGFLMEIAALSTAHPLSER